MKRILYFLKDYKKESVIGPLFKMLEAGFELIVPLVMANIINIGIQNNDKTYIMRMAGVLVLLGVIGLVCSLIAQFFAAKAAMGFGTALRNALFEHINDLSYSKLDKVGIPTLITRMTSDINQVQNGVNIVLRLFLRSPFLVLGALVMSYTISPSISIIFLMAVPVIAVVVFAIMRLTIPGFKMAQNKLDKLSLITRENLIGVRVIRAFLRQNEEMKAFKNASEELKETQMHVGRISSLMNPLTYILVNLSIVAIMYLGGMKVENGALLTGDVYALVNYMTQILLALIAMANLITNITKATASSIRIEEVFAIQVSTDSNREEDRTKVVSFDEILPAHTGVPHIEFQHVSFAYGESKEYALSDINFSVEKGEVVGVIGGTGSGKTTLVHLIPRFYEVSQGEILVNGRNVNQYSFDSIRDQVGIVPQKAVLFQGSIRDNLRWGKEDATEDEINYALEIAQAKEVVSGKKDGLDEMITSGGKNLSGGQRQRLTIARALIKKPEILILDDSASALDFKTDANLRKALATNLEHTTVFIVSQRAASIKQADKIIVLEDGAMVGCGIHEDLLKNCATYKEICLSQLAIEEVE